jgi:hypothetical protein
MNVTTTELADAPELIDDQYSGLLLLIGREHAALFVISATRTCSLGSMTEYLRSLYSCIYLIRELRVVPGGAPPDMLIGSSWGTWTPMLLSDLCQAMYYITHVIHSACITERITPMRLQSRPTKTQSNEYYMRLPCGWEAQHPST